MILTFTNVVNTLCKKKEHSNSFRSRQVTIWCSLDMERRNVVQLTIDTFQVWDGNTSRIPVEGKQVVGNELNLQSDSVVNKEAVKSDHVQRTPVEIIAAADAGNALKVTQGAANGVANGF